LGGVRAKIVGRDTASKKTIAIGHMKAAYVKEGAAFDGYIWDKTPEDLE
jgi:hypothetical protein